MITALAPLLATATADASGKLANIACLANLLRDAMQDAHGGSWRVVVDHDPKTSLILIRPNNEKPIAKPQRGEAA
jgi:hypothetical protein